MAETHTTTQKASSDHRKAYLTFKRRQRGMIVSSLIFLVPTEYATCRRASTRNPTDGSRIESERMIADSHCAKLALDRNARLFSGSSFAACKSNVRLGPGEC
ncbi:MAG: hypothetical protein KL863_21485 [Rhizobium sp.]|nr:hypothetical protein [Rhizobium sp.]